MVKRYGRGAGRTFRSGDTAQGRLSDGIVGVKTVIACHCAYVYGAVGLHIAGKMLLRQPEHAPEALEGNLTRLLSGGKKHREISIIVPFIMESPNVFNINRI